MDILRKNFADFLRMSQVKLEITGFDLDGFSQAMHQDLSRRLDMIAYIAFEDSGVVSDAEKVESIKALFQREFYE